MKKILSPALVLLLSLTACAGGTAQVSSTPAPSVAPAVETSISTPAPTPEATSASSALPFENSLTLDFSSGAGGWNTELILASDGSFTGNFHDSEMGASGEGYDSTMYVSDFSGKFTDIQDNGDGSWFLTLAEIATEKAPDQEWIAEETYGDQSVRVKYISSTPYGLEAGKDFILYAPNTPVEGLDEGFLSWWPGRFETPTPDTLNSFGLWNKEAGYGFFGSNA